MYKCKTCGKALAETALTCPNCGESDPFYNKEIKEWEDKLNKQETISTHAGKIIGSLVAFIFGIYGTINGHHWYDKLLGIAFVTGSSFYAFIKFMECRDDSKKYEETANLFRQKRDNLKVSDSIISDTAKKVTILGI